MEQEFQGALIASLSDGIAAGSVIVADEAPIIARLEERFPMGFNRIAWDQVPGARHSCPPKPRTALDPEAVLNFLNEFACSAGIGDADQVSVIGDNLTTVALIMSLSTFKRCLGSFLRIPQGTYLVTSDCEWCFTYTFEDDMYFGYAVRK